MSENTDRSKPMSAHAPELLPCPFCGRTDSTDNAFQDAAVTLHSVKTPIGLRGYEVACTCGAKGPRSLDGLDAISLWNSRTSHTPTSQEREPSA